MTHATGLEQVARLRAGQLDLGVFAHAEDYDGLEWEPLFVGEPVNVFLPREHHLASKPVLTPRDLSREELLTGPRAANPPWYDRFMALLREAGYRFQGVHELNNDPSDMLLAVAGGLGVALGPFSVKDATEAGRDVVRRPLDPQLSMPDTIVAWRANAPRQFQRHLADVQALARELYETTEVAG